jgi:ABC-type branched-subunit amino acid transport system ATPase component
MADAPLLRIRGLTKRFGGLTALKGIDLDVPQGIVQTIIGPNGSGKTTFFNLVSGLYVPSEGQVLLRRPDGSTVDLVGPKPFEITRLGVARTFQNLRLFPDMSVLENVMVGMHSRSRKGVAAAVLRTRGFKEEEARIRDRSEDLLKFFGDDLFPVRHEAARNLSYANQRRLEIVRAMATDPQVLLLDEPAAGMNPTEKSRLMEDMRRLKALGYTILLIEHDMILVRHISDRVVAFDHGEKIAEGTFDEVRQTPQVIEAYLGKGAAGAAGSA